MALLHKTTNGDGNTIKTVPLSIVIAGLVALCSTIGAQWTWFIAAAHERAVISDMLKKDVLASVAPDFARIDERLSALDQRLTTTESRQRVNEDTINRNSGWIEAQRAK